MSMTSQSVQRSNAWPYASSSSDYSSSNVSNVRSVLLQDDVANGNLNRLGHRPQFSYHHLNDGASAHQNDLSQSYQQGIHPQPSTTSQRQLLQQQQQQQHDQSQTISQSQSQHQPQHPGPQSLPASQAQQQQLHVKGPLQAQESLEDSGNGAIKSRPANNRKNSTEPVRRRTSRACDQCNHLRTKCDGKQPCGHCVETRLSCDYARLRKKRGKASKKELAEQATAEGNSEGMPTPSLKLSMSIAGKGASQAPRLHRPDDEVIFPAGIDSPSRSRPARRKSLNDHVGMSIITEAASNSSPSNMDASDTGDLPASGHQHMPPNGLLGSVDQRYSAIDMDGFANHNYGHPRHRLDSIHSSNGRINVMDLNQVYDVNLTGLHDQLGIDNTFVFPMDSPSALLMDGGAVPRSPGMASAGGASNSGLVNALSNSTIKYPVLRPLLPHIKSVIPQSLAYELLEHYFSSSSSAHPHPASPYLLGFIFSKRSFLRSSRLRECSPALLASMLWIAARTSNARALTSPPSVRGRVCQKLLNLSVSLLKPLIHGSVAGKAVSEYSGGLIINGSAMGGDGLAVDHLNAEKIAAGTVDDVATYMHIAIVVSASEDKSASLRWWTAAWNMAKELKLGRELPLNPPSPDPALIHEELLHDGEDHMDLDPTTVNYTEEDREERRRLWWVLYIVDRHLALCYNRPLTLLERECEGLLRPMDERAWQTGNFGTTDAGGSPGPFRRASTFEFTGPSIFGFFLPLMTILGEIVDLHQARQHPMLRYIPSETHIWDSQVQHVITQQLEAYERSMQSYQAHNMPTQSGFNENDSSTRNTAMTESQIHTKIAIAYSTHIMHVLHILTTGKWDPISLLDDNDLWISSPSFVTAVGHAVSGAEAVTDILSYDPELSFMPFLYGMYLLQGSFLLLLIADKLQTDASPNVVRACETIVRAHEACVVTLNTEYQRAFRKVMQSALAQVRGRVPEDAGEQQRRRRETLALYRWTGDGSGLAI